MSLILRLPSITAQSDTEKIEQIRRYLYQTVKEINWALGSLDTTPVSEREYKEIDGESMFSVLKPLIIKSADIINNYYGIIKGRLDGIYAPKEELDKITSWLRIGQNTLEIGEMIDGEFVSLMKFMKNGVEIMKPFTGYHRHINVVGSIKELSEECEIGMIPVTTNQDTTELPEGFLDGIGFIHRTAENILIQITDLSTGNTATIIKSNGAWGDWKIAAMQ